MANDTTAVVENEQVAVTAEAEATGKPGKGAAKQLLRLASEITEHVCKAEQAGAYHLLMAGRLAHHFVNLYASIYGVSGRDVASRKIESDINFAAGTTWQISSLIGAYHAYRLLGGEDKPVKDYGLSHAALREFAKLVEPHTPKGSKETDYRVKAGAESAAEKAYTLALEGDEETGTKVRPFSWIRDQVDGIRVELMEEKAETLVNEAAQMRKDASKTSDEKAKKTLLAGATANDEKAEKLLLKADELASAIELRNTPKDQRPETGSTGGGESSAQTPQSMTEEAYRATIVQFAKSAETEPLAQDLALFFAHREAPGELLRRLFGLIDWTRPGMLTALATAVNAFPKVARENFAVILEKTAPRPEKGKKSAAEKRGELTAAELTAAPAETTEAAPTN